MLLRQRQSAKDHDAAHRTRTECMRRTTEDRHFTSLVGAASVMVIVASFFRLMKGVNGDV